MCKAEDMSSIPGLGRSTKESTATHSSILVWRMPRTEEPVGYSPQGCKESGTNEATEHTHKLADKGFSTDLRALVVMKLA